MGKTFRRFNDHEEGKTSRHSRNKKLREILDKHDGEKHRNKRYEYEYEEAEDWDDFEDDR